MRAVNQAGREIPLELFEPTEQGPLRRGTSRTRRSRSDSAPSAAPAAAERAVRSRRAPVREGLAGSRKEPAEEALFKRHDPMVLIYHELRAPLGLIVTAARAAAAQSQEQYVRERLQTMARVGERMLATAGQVLALSQVAEAADDEQITDPEETVAHVVSELADLGVPVTFGKGSCNHHRVRGNGAALQTIVQSLLMNAIDHGVPDQPIFVSAECQGDAWRLTVQNTTDRRSRHRGLGLGLYLCEQVANSQGWSLDVASRPRTFAVTIELPLAVSCSGRAARHHGGRRAS